MTPTAQYLLSGASWNPLVICSCAAAAVAYAAWQRWRLSARAGYFTGATAIVALAIGSPLNALADGYLFSAHMLQHMLLLLIAPPLLLLGAPEPAVRWQRAAVHPLVGWLAGVGAMWVWHEQTLCELATRTTSVRTVQIASLLVLGLMFWSPIIGPSVRHRLSSLGAVAYLFTACIACSLLGILIAFAPDGAVCPAFLHPPNDPAVLRLIRIDWQLTPERDQQIGGLIMWIPGCAIYLSGIMAVLARWYRAAEVHES